VADDLAHIQSLIPLFPDSRYICVAGRPVFLVYKASQLAEPKRTTEMWRREAEREGLKGLFLVRVESIGDECDDPREMGFDSSLRFQPRWSLVTSERLPRRKWWHRRKLGTAERGYSENLLCDYKCLVKNALAIAPPMYPCIPCVCPGWDNSPRREEGAIILTTRYLKTMGSGWPKLSG
jgi:hypothetical protein